MVQEPKIYSCQEWGARPARSSFAVVEPKDIVVHHMAWPNRLLITDTVAAVAEGFKVARKCQADHMDGNGWSDTGQDFTNTRDGVILEGRHGALGAARIGKNVQSAHAADPDTGADDNMSYGIENEGTYSTEPMPTQQWASLVALLAFLSDRSGRDSSLIIGHRDTGCATACPGNWLESQLPRLRAAVHAFKLTGGQVKQPLPVAPPAPGVTKLGWRKHIVVSRSAKKAAMWEVGQDKPTWVIDMLTRGVNGGQEVTGGDTPNGTYRTNGKLTYTTDSDTDAMKMAYGPVGTAFIWLEAQADVVARHEEGIGIHAGGTALGFALSQSLNQPLMPTLGCMRVHGKDLITLDQLVIREDKAGYFIKISVGD